MTFKQANKMSTLQQNTNVNDNMKVDIKKRITIKQKNNAVYNSNRESLCHLLAFGIILGIITANAIVAAALRNVNLIIEPPAVRRGQHAILRCLYDLEGTPLYSAKFYRGQLEFYRYTPGEFPNTKVFPFPGIYVDVTSSNATQVLIRNVGFGLSGNFSCEVTADRPLFSTATAVGTMQVVELPEKRPQLFTEHTRYEPGDILRANCSTPPSRPRAELQFTINNMVVNNVDTQHIRTIDNLIASRISLKLQLQGIHFSSTNPSILYHNANMGAGYYNGGQMLNSVHGLGGMGGAGGLLLRCTATIGDLYQEYKEIELGTPQKDPIPARVTLSSSSSMRNFFSYFSSSAASRTKLSCFPIAFYLLLSGSLTTMLLTLPTLKLHLKDLKFSMQQTELILPQKYLLNNNSNNKINNNKNTNKDENIHSTHAQRLLCER